MSPDWIPLTSQSPSDIIAAAKKSTTYLINASGEGDVVPVTHLGTPLYVQGLSKSYSAALPDYYEIPSLNDSGAVIGSLNCQLNASHTAIYVGGAVEYGQPRTSGTVAQITPQQALAEIAAQHHTGLKAGTEPHLIYFPFDLSAEETGQINWRGGGNSMDDPMWEFVGTDGSQHFAGADGRAYYWNELPLAP